MTKMTEEQRRIAEENIDLAFRALRYKARRLPTYKAIGIEAEDILEIAFRALCKAAMTFDADKGFLFSTYFKAVFENELKMELKRLNTVGRRADRLCDSLDVPVKATDGKAPVSRYETIPDKRPTPEERAVKRCEREELAAAVNGLPEEWRKVVVLYYIDNVTQREIGKKIGRAQKNVCMRLKKATAKMRDELKTKR